MKTPWYKVNLSKKLLPAIVLSVLLALISYQGTIEYLLRKDVQVFPCRFSEKKLCSLSDVEVWETGLLPLSLHHKSAAIDPDAYYTGVLDDVDGVGPPSGYKQHEMNNPKSSYLKPAGVYLRNAIDALFLVYFTLWFLVLRLLKRLTV